MAYLYLYIFVYLVESDYVHKFKIDDVSNKLKMRL